MTINALRWGRVSRRGTYEISSKTSSGDDASLQDRAVARGTMRERAGACGTKLTRAVLRMFAGGLGDSRMTKIKRRDVPNEFTQFILVKEGCGPETCESLADGIANATGQANEYPGTVVAIYRLERLVSSTRRKAKVFDPNTLREARK